MIVRWLYSTNAKDIARLFLGMFYALASIGVLGFIVWCFGIMYFWAFFFIVQTYFIIELSNEHPIYIQIWCAVIVTVFIYILCEWMELFTQHTSNVSSYVATYDVSSPSFINSPLERPVIVPHNPNTQVAGIAGGTTLNFLAATTIAKSVAGGPVAKIGTFAGVLAVGGVGMFAFSNLTTITQAFRSTTATGTSAETLSALPTVGSSGTSTGEISQSSVFPFISSFFDYVYSSIEMIIEVRTSMTGNISILFTQYNLMVGLALVCTLVSFVGIIIVCVCLFIRVNKDALMYAFPRTLGRIATWRSLNLLIMVNGAGAILNMFTVLNCTYFLFNNYIPAEYGAICDTALEASVHAKECVLDSTSSPCSSSQEH